jgi:transcriptional regulator with XRE-family HTH domain
LFYNKVLALCYKQDITISRLIQDIGLSKANATYWKKGAAPKISTVKKIAEYFSVPVEYLLDDTSIDADLQSSHVSEQKNNLDPQEEELLKVFKTLSNKNKALALARIYELEEEQNK